MSFVGARDKDLVPLLAEYLPHQRWFAAKGIELDDRDITITHRTVVAENYWDADIEQVLLRSGCVSEAAVVGMPSRELGEEVGAFVVPARRTDEAELIAVCRAALAPYKVPRRIFLLDSLPKHSGGKVIKSELLRLLEGQVGQ